MQAKKITNQTLHLIILLLTLTAAPTLARASEKVVLQLRWDNQFQFAGYYAAKWQGYYEAEGIDVEIRVTRQTISVPCCRTGQG